MSDSNEMSDVTAEDLKRLAGTLREYAQMLEEASESIGKETLQLAVKSFEDNTLGVRTNGFVNKVQSKARRLKAELAKINARRSKKKT